MLDDKELKKKFLKEFSENPKKYYPESISEFGFSRRECSKCSRKFWSIEERNICGDSACEGGYSFINNTPASKKLDYIDIWKNFFLLLKKEGYTPIERYPVVARWRDDLHFVEASIDDFIPYVIKGQVKPPANPLTIPQPCLRFNDIDNVGITGSHYTCFIMIGQLAFEKPENYKIDNYFQHLMKWFVKGMGINQKEIILHEDAWAGSGNFGPSIEFFSRGMELANQVYMQYTQSDSRIKDLKLKVLDMGLGQERNAWLSTGKSTSYESTFPTVIKYMKKNIGFNFDSKIMGEFIPYSSLLNLDETSNIEKTWEHIAKNMKIDVNSLKETVLPYSSLYSIAEHTRSFLMALNDGGLPSNVGGGYNIRVLIRRCFAFMEKYGWDLDIAKICELHAKYLEIFPELKNSLNTLPDVLDHEKSKYNTTKTKGLEIILKIIKSEEIKKEKLIELYESNGVSPEQVLEESKKIGKTFEIPENFYSLITDKHRKTDIKRETELDFPSTEKLYYENQNEYEFDAKVLDIKNDKVILDKTLFYPEGGGQESDTGKLNGGKVFDVQKNGEVIIHRVENIKFKKGDKIHGVIDAERRKQLTIHHTSVHIINGITRKLLGSHVWQCGTRKSEEKATLDITHYKIPEKEIIDEIEKKASDIVLKGIASRKYLMERTEAEKKFGMGIYQGGAIPRKELRIQEIPGVDIEACGGTHLENTKDLRKIYLTSVKKIQDGVIRFSIVSGKAADEYEKEQKELLYKVEKITDSRGEKTVEDVKKLFEKWKSLRKNSSGIEEMKNIITDNLKNGISISKIDGSSKDLIKISKNFKNPKIKTLIIFGGKDNSFIISSDKSKSIMEKIFSIVDGKGGGSEKFVQGFCTIPKEKDIKKIRDVLND